MISISDILFRNEILQILIKDKEHSEGMNNIVKSTKGTKSILKINTL